jgi:hypothetical protein
MVEVKFEEEIYSILISLTELPSVLNGFWEGAHLLIHPGENKNIE